MDNIPTLIRRVTIMQGVPGSGKSTWVSKNRPEATICSADHFFIGEDGVYRFDPTKLNQAHGECFKKFINACFYAEVKDVVVDNTNINPVDVAPYMAFALAYEFEVQIIWVQELPQVAAARCLHGVPAASIERMHRDLKNWNGPKRWKRVVAMPTKG